MTARSPITRKTADPALDDFIQARNAAAYADHLEVVAEQARAAAAAADLADRRQKFTDMVLDDPHLRPGAAGQAADRLGAQVTVAVSEFMSEIDAINESLNAARAAARELGLHNDPGRTVYDESGIRSGLVIDGELVEPVTGVVHRATGILNRALGQARRDRQR